MMLTHRVTLQSMRFHTHIGVLPHETEIAQSIEVDVSVWVSREDTAEGSDGVLDYRNLYSLAAATVTEGHIRYLEDLVERIAGKALAIEGVERVLVAARKPHVALPGPLAHAEVSIERRRG